MEIKATIYESVTVVDLSGELDGVTAPQAQLQILPLAATAQKILLDMTRVTYISSAGLRMLLLVYRQVSGSRGKIALVGLTEMVRDTMDTTGFLAHFATYDQLEQGLIALSSRSGLT